MKTETTTYSVTLTGWKAWTVLAGSIIIIVNAIVTIPLFVILGITASHVH